MSVNNYAPTHPAFKIAEDFCNWWNVGKLKNDNDVETVLARREDAIKELVEIIMEAERRGRELEAILFAKTFPKKPNSNPLDKRGL